MVLRVRSRSSSVVVGVSFRRVEEGGEERRKKRHVNIMMKWKLEFYAGAFKVFCFVFVLSCHVLLLERKPTG